MKELSREIQERIKKKHVAMATINKQVALRIYVYYKWVRIIKSSDFNSCSKVGINKSATMHFG